ncbi:MAG: cytochrome c biogenesis protein CcsA [Polyangiaceae bacterium]
MTAFSYVLLAIGAILYAMAGGVFFADAARRGAAAGRAGSGRSSVASAPQRAFAPWLLTAGAAAHLGYITVASFVSHTCPVGSIHFILSFVAISAVFVFTIARVVARHKGPLENIDALGLALAPLGLAFLLGTYLLDKPGVGKSLGAPFLAMHVIVNVLGVSLFLLAGAAAVLYLVQERRLKHKKLRRLGGLPPLDTLDRAVHRFLIVGFPLLTMGIVSGTFWAHQLEAGSTDEVMRIIFGYATWLLIAGVLLLRAAAGWRGKRSAYGTLLGLLFALCVLFIYMFRPTPAPTQHAGVFTGQAFSLRGKDMARFANVQPPQARAR